MNFLASENNDIGHLVINGNIISIINSTTDSFVKIIILFFIYTYTKKQNYKQWSYNTGIFTSFYVD